MAISLKRKSAEEMIGGATGGLMGVLLDFSERLKRLEKALEESQGRTPIATDLAKLIQEQAHQISILANRDDTILHWQETHDWLHSKAQEAGAPPTMATPTTASPSDAGWAYMTRTIPELSQQLGELMVAGHSHAEPCSACVALRAALREWSLTHAQDVSGPNSTSQKQGSPPSDAPATPAGSQDLRSSESGEEGWLKDQLEMANEHEKLERESLKRIINEAQAGLHGVNPDTPGHTTPQPSRSDA